MVGPEVSEADVKLFQQAFSVPAPRL